MIPRKSINIISPTLFRLLLLLLFIISSHQSLSHPRNLDSITDTSSICHDPILNASSTNILGDVDVTNLASSYGIVFSIENNAYELDGSGVDGDDIIITKLSIYLDGTEGTNYSVYVVEDDYVTVGEDGSTLTLLGGVLGDGGEVDASGTDEAGWRQVGKGSIEDFSMNAEGMAIIHLDSAIALPPRSLKSVYIRCTAVALLVGETYDDGKPLVGEALDEFAKVEQEYDSLKIRVGRGVLPQNWASGLPGEVFDTFYPPRRFLGNLYVAVPLCTTTVRNSFFDFYAIGESDMRYRYRMVAPRFSSHHVPKSHGHNNPFNRMLQENSNATDSTTGCFETDDIYPVLDGEFKKFAMKKYSEALPPSITVDDVTFTVKADQEMYSNEGPCKNIRFIFNEVLVYAFSNPDEMTVAELSEWPFLNDADRRELLLNLIEFNSKFSQFGKIEGPIVTDPTLPTRMPTSRPSVAPTISFGPTEEPSGIVSDVPSAIPSVILSSHPSSSPSAIPSDFSSKHPSSFPSETFSATTSAPPSDPMNTFVGTITTTVEFQYDVRYLPSRFSDDDMKQFIIGNVTETFRETLFMEPPLLQIVNNYGLELNSELKPFVEEDKTATDVWCEPLPENGNSICKRFTLRLSFDHMSTISTELVRFWVLRVSEYSGGNLNSTYSGLVSVKSDQIISFEGTSAAPAPEEEEIFFEVISKSLNVTLSTKNYTVTDFGRIKIEFLPYESSRKRLRLFEVGRDGRKRRLQSGDGELKIYYNVSAEYPLRMSGEGDFMEINFDNLIEDSINREGLGDEIKKSLEERNVEVVENAIVKATTFETPAPTPSPTYDRDERAPPTVFGNVEKTDTISSSPPNASVIVGVVFAIIFLCCTLALYMYYLRYLHFIPAKDDDSYEEYQFEPSLLTGDEHFEWGQIKRTSIRPSNFSDEPDDIPYPYYKEAMQKGLPSKPFEIITDDANTTSSTISDSQVGVGESMVLSESMIRFNAFDRRVQHQNDTLPADFEEQVRQRIKSKQEKVNHSSDDYLAPYHAKQSWTSNSSFEDRLMSKLAQEDSNVKKNGDFNDRLRSKLSKEDSQESFELRLRSKLTRENPKPTFADWHMADEKVQRKLGSNSDIPSDISFHSRSPSKDDSVHSFEARLRRKLSHDSKNDSSNALDHSMTSVDFLNERIQQKLARDSFGASTSSLEDIDVRIQRKIDESSVGGNSASSNDQISKHGPLKDAEDMQERIRRKLSGGNGGKSSSADVQRPGVQKIASSSTMQDRIRRKLAQGDAQTLSSVSNSTMQDKQRRKLSQDSVDSSGPVVEKMSSINRMENRIQEKLARDISSSPIADVQRPGVQKTSSMYLMEQRIKEKLSQETAQTPLSSIDDQRPSVQKISSQMEQHIQEKLAGENTQPPPSTGRDAQRPGVEKMASTSMMQRIQEKVARESSHVSRSSSFNTDRTASASTGDDGAKSSSAQKPGVQKMASTSMMQRIQAKMAQNDAQISSATGADIQRPGVQKMGSLSRMEQRIQEKMVQDSVSSLPPSLGAQMPGVQKIASTSMMQHIQAKMAQNDAQISSATGADVQRPGVQKMVSLSRMEQRIQEKMVHDSVSSLPRSDLGAQRPGVQKMASTSMMQRIQAKMAQNDAQISSATSADVQRPGVQKMGSWSRVEQCIQEKMVQDSVPSLPPSLGAQMPGVQKIDSTSMMQRIQAKMAQNDAQVSYATGADVQRPGVQKMGSLSRMKQRIQEKMVQDSVSSLPPSDLGDQMPGVQKIASTSMMQCIQAKMAQTDAQISSATGADVQRPGVQKMGSWSRVEQHIQTKLTRGSTLASDSSASNTLRRIDSMDALESNLLSGKRTTDNIMPREAFELKSALHLSQGVPEDDIQPAKGWESSSPKESWLFTVDNNIQRKMSDYPTETEPLKSQADSIASFKTKLQRKLAESASAGCHQVSVSPLDKSTMSTATTSMTSVGATVSTASDESPTEDLDEKIKKKITTRGRPVHTMHKKSQKAKSQQYG